MARLRLTKIASMTGELDRIAEELEKIDPKLALAVDRVSDRIEVLSDIRPDIEKEVFTLAKSGHISILKDPKYKEYLKIQNDWGDTPLHWLALNGKTEILKPEYKEILEIQNNWGMTPLYSLAVKGKTEILKPEYKEILKIQDDEYGDTPLHLLAMEGKTEILKPEYKEILKIRNKRGETPLHDLAGKGKTEILKPEYKEILKIKNKKGQTPVDILKKKKEIPERYQEFLTK